MSANLVRPAAVVVLAAGEGTRMRSSLPKVMHAIGGRPLVGHVLATAATLDPEHVVVVLGHAREVVGPYVTAFGAADGGPDAPPLVVVQDEQRGTGHAVRLALDALPGLDGVVVVVAGDVPLLAPETLAGLLAVHVDEGFAATILSARFDDPSGYGRIVRDSSGAVVKVVEHRDATPAERTVDEINSGTYAFDAALLRDALGRLSTDNAAGEEYLTDVVGLLRDDDRAVGAVVAIDAAETNGVNDQAQLAEARRELRDRVLLQWMRAGVVVVDPATTWVDVDVRLDAEAVLLPNTQLHGRTSVGAGAVVGPNSTLTDTAVGAGATVSNATCVQAEIGEAATVGPYTYLRPGTRLGRGAKAGGFVEMKNARLGDGSKVPHLSYVGDAEIGSGSNIGAATVFVNYDGQDKHRTVVGDEVRIGSDTMLVAPLEIGDGAYTAAGSVITEDVPPGAMAVGRARQRVVEGWVGRKRPGSASALAAERAAGRAGSGAADGDLDERESMGPTEQAAPTTEEQTP